MSEMTFEQRCTLAQNSLPQAEYRTWLTALHTDMLARIAELEKSINDDKLHQTFIDSLPQDDEKMYMQIDEWARQSYKRHQNSVRGQQITQLDSFDTHVVLATLRWVKTNGEIK